MTINKFEAAYFSDLSYSDNGDLDQSYLDAGWTKLANSKDPAFQDLDSDGYYGAAFVKVVNGIVTDVVIAHRGTEANIEDAVIADGAIALQLPTNSQVDNAKSFVQELKIEFQRQYGIDTEFDSVVTQTGHSLGGYLAIHAANQQSIDSGEHIRAITFDNPKTGITSTNAVIETYLNQPGLVNSAGSGEHLGMVYRLDSSDPIFDNTVVSTLNSIAVAGVSNPITAGAILVVGGVGLIPAYATIATPLIKQASIEHRLGSIISRLDTAQLSAANYTTTGAISYYLVGEYSFNSNAAVGGVVAEQWKLLENKSYYNNNIKQYADSFLSIVREPEFEYSAKNIVIGSNGADSINLDLDNAKEDKFILTLDGDDSINLSEGKNIVDAGSGNDTISYENYDNGLLGFEGLDIELGSGVTYVGDDAGDSQKDIFTNVENAIGSKYDDLILGSNLANKIEGGEGDDNIEGWAGNDLLYGNSGDDSIYGDEGNDTIYGGSGDDFIDGGEGRDILVGNDGDDIITGGLGNDIIYDSAGFDSYVFYGDYGTDVIVDDDKYGLINVDGKTLFGTATFVKTVNSNDIYQLTLSDKSYDLVTSGRDLLVRSSGDSLKNQVIIKDFANGNFGITLQDKEDAEGEADDNTDPSSNLDNFKDYFKDLLNDFLDDAQTISDFLQDALNDLLQSQVFVAPARRDPLSLDLDGDGLELVNVNQSTAFFDLDVVDNGDGTYTSDGFKEQVGWVKGDDGILTLDKNNNGTIDNILELFGKENKTGTEELREYDLNGDGKIDSQDSIFNQLKVWQDVNQDGVSQSGELKTLSQLGVASINLNNLTTKNAISEGNLIISEGSYTL